MRDGKPTVLIVDDEIDMRLLVRVILEGADLGIEVVGEAEDGLAALAVFDTLTPPEIPDVVILDNRMPGRSGMEVAGEMLRREPRQKVVLFSAFLNPALQEQAMALGVKACVGKNDFADLPQLVSGLAGGAQSG